MTCTMRLMVWAACALALGFCVGYFSSSQFCSVSIEKRAQKEVALNQVLREIMAKRSCLLHSYLDASFLNLPHIQAVENQLPQVHAKLAHIFKIYYDAKSATQIATLYDEQTAIIAALVK